MRERTKEGKERERKGSKLIKVMRRDEMVKDGKEDDMEWKRSGEGWKDRRLGERGEGGGCDRGSE